MKNELITQRADKIIEFQLFVRVNLDIENHINSFIKNLYYFDFQPSTRRVKSSMNFSG